MPQDPFAGVDLSPLPVAKDRARERERTRRAKDVESAKYAPRPADEDDPFAGFDLSPQPAPTVGEKFASAGRAISGTVSGFAAALPTQAARALEAVGGGSGEKFEPTTREMRSLVYNAALKDALAEGLSYEEARETATWFADPNRLPFNERKDIARREWVAQRKAEGEPVGSLEELPRWQQAGIMYLDSLAKETLEGAAQPDPRLAESMLWTKVPQGLTSAGLFMAGGAALKGFGLSAGAAIGASGSLIESSAAWHEADFYLRQKVEAGEITEEQANEKRWLAFLAGAAIGQAERLPLARMLNRLDKKSGGFFTRETLKAAAGELTEEAAQEAFQSLSTNVVAAQLYDEERKLLEGVADNAKVGGIVGLVLSLGISGLQRSLTRAGRGAYKRQILAERGERQRRVAGEQGYVGREMEDETVTINVPANERLNLEADTFEATVERDAEGNPRMNARGEVLVRDVAGDMTDWVPLDWIQRAEPEQPPAGAEEATTQEREPVESQGQPAPPGAAPQSLAEKFAAVNVGTGRLTQEQAASLAATAKPAPESGFLGLKVTDVFPEGDQPLAQREQYEDGEIVVDARYPERKRRQILWHATIGHYGRDIVSDAWTGVRDRLEAAGVLDGWRAEQIEGRRLARLPAPSADLAREEAVAQAAEEVTGFLEWATRERARFEQTIRALRAQARRNDGGRATRFLQAVIDLFRRAARALNMGPGSVQQQLDWLAKTVAIGNFEKTRPGDALEVASVLLEVQDAIQQAVSRGVRAQRAAQPVQGVSEVEQPPSPPVSAPAGPALVATREPQEAPVAQEAPAQEAEVPAAAPPVPAAQPPTPAQAKRARQKANRSLARAAGAREAGRLDAAREFERQALATPNLDSYDRARVAAEIEGRDQLSREEMSRRAEPLAFERAQPRASERRAEPSQAESAIEAYEAGEEERFSPAPPVGSEAFKRWFGDSKVVDENGAPLVVYHGTGSTFTSFKAREPVAGFAGIYLTNDPGEASAFAATSEWRGGQPQVKPVYARISNPAPRSIFEFGLSGAALTDKAKKLGYDGYHDTVHDEWVAFAPEQIKSATGNRGTFDPASPDIRFSPGGVIQEGEDGPSFVARDATWLDHVKRVALYSFESATRAQRDITEAGRKIRTMSDVVLAETLFWGRRANDIRWVGNEQRKVHRLMKRWKIKREEIDDFLRALTAPKRNRTMAKRNPGVFDEAVMPGTGADSTGQFVGARRAQEIRDAVEADPRREGFEKIAEITKGVNQWALAKRVEYGLLSPADRDVWVGDFGEWYMPLRNEELDSDAVPFMARGQGFSVPKKLSERAEGRTTTSGSPLAWSFVQAGAVADRARRNDVALAMASLVADHPNEDLWSILEGGKGLDDEQKKALDAVTFHYKDKGEDRYIVLRGRQGKALARSLERLGMREAAVIQKILGPMSKFFTRLMTQWNPEFMFRNVVKDVQTAGVRLGVTVSPRAAAKLPFNVVRALPAIYRVLRAEHKGETPPSGYWENRFLRARELGGQTGWSWVFRYEEAVLAFKKAESQGNLRDAWNAFIEPYYDLQESFEMATRVAAFDAYLEAGLSENRAAAEMKQITVDFNRKGEWTGALNSLYWFFNPSVQGNRMVLATMASTGLRGATWFTAIAGLGYMLSLWNGWVGEEEDRNRWDETSDWMKNQYATVLLPFEFTVPFTGTKIDRVMLPIAWGYNVPFSVGVQVAEVQRGREMSEGIFHVFQAITESFNPMGSTPSLSQFITPSLADPLIQVGQNLSWSGSQIRPKNYGNRPQSWLEWPDTNPALSRFARTLSRWTGGTSREGGWIDRSPEDLEHLWTQYTGGLGRFLTRAAWDVPTMLVAGEGVPARDIPFMRSFIAGPNPRVVMSQYRRAQRQVENAAGEVKDGERPKRPQLLPLVDYTKAMKKRTKALQGAGREQQALDMMRAYLAVYRQAMGQD